MQLYLGLLDVVAAAQQTQSVDGGADHRQGQGEGPQPGQQVHWGGGGARQSHVAPSCGHTPGLSLTLTHDATPGVFVQVCSGVSHHRQDVATGGDVDFLPAGASMQVNR